jgi:hypothetical protein
MEFVIAGALFGLIAIQTKNASTAMFAKIASGACYVLSVVNFLFVVLK